MHRAKAAVLMRGGPRSNFRPWTVREGRVSWTDHRSDTLVEKLRSDPFSSQITPRRVALKRAFSLTSRFSAVARGSGTLSRFQRLIAAGGGNC